MASIVLLLTFFIIVPTLAENFALQLADKEKFSCKDEGICKLLDVHSEQGIIDAIEASPYHVDRHDSSNLVSEIAFKYSKFERLPRKLFEMVKSLTILSAVKVGLIEISPVDIPGENNILHLNVSANQIRYLPSLSLFPHLVSIDLSKNLISTFDDIAFFGISAISIVDLSFNQITTYNEIQLTPAKLKRLNLQHNQLKKFNSAALEIEELNVNDNQLEILFLLRQPTTLSADNNNLTEFTITDRLLKASLKNNRIAKLKFEEKSRVESLSMSGNKLTNESLAELKDADKLKALDLSNNMLRNLEVGTFAKMSLLEELNLAYTSIANLSSDHFAHQGNLKVLNISYNNLGLIDLEIFAPLKNLEALDINGNNLTIFDRFERLKKVLPGLKAIALEDNKWSHQYYLKLSASINTQGIRIGEAVKKSHAPEMKRPRELLEELGKYGKIEIRPSNDHIAIIIFAASYAVFLLGYCYYKWHYTNAFGKFIWF